MAYFQDNEFYQMTELVKSCQSSNQVDKRLEIAHNLCQMLSTQTLDEDMDKEVKNMEKYTRTLLTDSKFRKNVHKRQALMEREPITYFGEDLQKDDAYDFDAEFEEHITEIEFKITTFLGNVLAFVQEQSAI
jgi:hypothetical protein